MPLDHPTPDDPKQWVELALRQNPVRTAADFRILPGALAAMKKLQEAGYLLFLVSNQPNQAKRKACREPIWSE